MKKILFIAFAILLFGETSFAQVKGKFWIVFTDKNNSLYSISTPSAYLSTRCIARRVKYGIPVKYNDLPPNPAYIDSVLSKGVTLLNRSKWFNAISIYTDDTTKMASIRALAFVQSSKFVNKVKPHEKRAPDFIESENPHSISVTDTFTYASSYNQNHMIKVDCLNDMGYRGKGKQIAQIDARFGRANTLPAFDSLNNRGQVLGTWDFVWEKAYVYDDTNNVDAHGEEVLSDMAGNIPDQFLGDAVDAKYYLLRTSDIASEYMIEDDNWTSAAEYADSAGADVITTSLNYTQFDDANTNYTYADMNGHTAVASIAATICAEKGMVVCASAGNYGGGSWHYVGSPADADSILTVGAVNAYGAYASFSSTGPTSDKRIKPDVAAQGQYAAFASPNGGVTFGNGTSLSTPIIAGAVASLWQADSNANNFEIMNAIKQSASQYSHPDSLLGYGIPGFCLAKTIAAGIQENKIVTSLTKVYPDPFINNITVSFFSSIEQDVNVKMVNSLGQLISQTKWKVAAGGNTLINLGGLQNLTNGIYILVLTDEKGSVFTSKLMKL
jgi:serine protease AprX